MQKNKAKKYFKKYNKLKKSEESAIEQLEKNEYELFNDFYEFQNSVKLDEEQSEIIKKVIKN